MTSYELFEYGTLEIELDSSSQRILAKVDEKYLKVSVGTSPGTCRITATQYVGALVTPACSILIKPKVSLENLFTMLGVGLEQKSWRHEQFSFGQSRDLLRELSQFFARSVQQATNTGLLHAYRTENERLTGIRGRIDFVNQIRRPGNSALIDCTFDEYTVDVIENRILKAACKRLLLVGGLQPKVRTSLKQMISVFESVSDSPVRSDAVEWIKFNRLNQHYEPALRLAQLVLQNLSLLDIAGQRSASSFLVDMNELFQRYITERLKQELRSRLDVVPEPNIYLGKDRQISMNPDLMFRQNGNNLFVGDLKYKISEDGKGRSSDYYQLLAYLTATGLQRGVLIYCQNDGQAPLRRTQVVNSGQELLTYPLNMSGTRQQLETSVAELANWISAEAIGDHL